MEGLIPLILHTERSESQRPEPRSTQARRRIRFSLPLSAWTPQTQNRRQSLHLPAQASRHSLLAPPPSPRLPTPSSASEWRKTIDEIKRKYAARKYRSCSMVCCEILEDLAKKPDTQPLYLIYLHFYAASSFEWCAWSLSSSSAYRTKLLCDAQSHYMETEALLVAMEGNMAESAESPSSNSRSSLSSPGLSVSSRASSACSASSSPRTSIFSLDDDASAKSAPPPVQAKLPKRVSFFNLPDLVEADSEPGSRPDSPTLGFSSMSLFPVAKSTGRPNSTSILKYPSEQNKLTASNSSNGRAGNNGGFNRVRASLPATLELVNENVVIHSDDSSDRNITPSSSSGSSSGNAFDIESFLQARNLSRSRAQLAELRSQVTRHRAAVDELLLSTATEENSPTSPTPPSPSKPMAQNPRHTWAASPSPRQSTTDLQTIDPKPTPMPRQRRPTLRVDTDMSPTTTTTIMMPGDDAQPPPRMRKSSSIARPAPIRIQSPSPSPTKSPIHPPGPDPPPPPTSSSSSSSSGRTTPTTRTGKDEDIHERIERLRAGGWQRKRFDSRRYESLRESVLSELRPGGR